MIQIRHALPIARPYSVLEADARFRRAETMPEDRLARVIRSVQDSLADAQLDRMRKHEGAELSAWSRFLGEPDDN